jgi:hypothetical protein
MYVRVSNCGDFFHIQFSYKPACALSWCEATMGDMRVAYSVLAAKLEGNRTLEGPACRWEDNIEMYCHASRDRRY